MCCLLSIELHWIYTGKKLNLKDFLTKIHFILLKWNSSVNQICLRYNHPQWFNQNVRSFTSNHVDMSEHSFLHYCVASNLYPIWAYVQKLSYRLLLLIQCTCTSMLQTICILFEFIQNVSYSLSILVQFKPLSVLSHFCHEFGYQWYLKKDINLLLTFYLLGSRR